MADSEEPSEVRTSRSTFSDSDLTFRSTTPTVVSSVERGTNMQLGQPGCHRGQEQEGERGAGPPAPPRIGHP